MLGVFPPILGHSGCSSLLDTSLAACASRCAIRTTADIKEMRRQLEALREERESNRVRLQRDTEEWRRQLKADLEALREERESNMQEWKKSMEANRVQHERDMEMWERNRDKN